MGAVVGALLWTVGAAPVASADVEPNGTIFEAEGPIVGGQDIQGALGPRDRHDWYVLHVEGSHQLHLTSPQTESPFGGCIAVALTDEDGVPVGNDYTSPAGKSTFYVYVGPVERPIETCWADQSYSFRIDPAHALVDGPGRRPFSRTAEPNDVRSQAGGPLVGGIWYQSVLETANDVDWLRFYTHPKAREIDVQTVVHGPDCLRPLRHRTLLRSASGRVLASSVGSHDTIRHFVRERAGGQRFYISSDSNGVSPYAVPCIGSATTVRVMPADAVMTATEVREGCADGRRSARRAKRKAARDKRALARARARGTATRALRRKLKRDRRALKAGRKLVSAYCAR